MAAKSLVDEHFLRATAGFLLGTTEFVLCLSPENESRGSSFDLRLSRNHN